MKKPAVDLLDDGTMDTVVEVTCQKCMEPVEFRYSDTSNFRGPDGDFTDSGWKSFCQLVRDDFENDGCPNCGE